MAKTRHVGSDFVDALPIDGERRLMLAVLIDAIRLLSTEQPPDSHPQLYRAWVKELAWLQSDDHTYSFSFVNICGALGFDADYVRRYVLTLPGQSKPLRICRYAAKVGESWQRQTRPVGRPLQAMPSNARRSANSKGAAARVVIFGPPPEPVYAAGSM